MFAKDINQITPESATLLGQDCSELSPICIFLHHPAFRDGLFLEILIKRDADINFKARNKRNRTPFMMFIKANVQFKDPVKILETLLSAGPDLDHVDDFGDTALSLSIPNINIIETLLKSGANPNIEDSIRQTVFSSTLYPDVLKLLIRYGADINKRDHIGDSALMLAGEHITSVQILLEAGANIDYKTVYGRSAFDYAKSNEMKTLLLSGRICESR